MGSAWQSVTCYSTAPVRSRYLYVCDGSLLFLHMILMFEVLTGVVRAPSLLRGCQSLQSQILLLHARSSPSHTVSPRSNANLMPDQKKTRILMPTHYYTST